MSRPRRYGQLLIGTLLAEALLVAGIALILSDEPLNDRLPAGVVMLAAGYLVAMTLVIDPLVPDAGRWFVLTLKLACGLALGVGVGAACLSLFAGRGLA